MTVAKISRGGGAADYLVQPTTATGTLQITFENVKQDPADDKVLVFENLYVYKPDSNDSENVVATIDTFCVRTQ